MGPLLSFVLAFAAAVLLNAQYAFALFPGESPLGSLEAGGLPAFLKNPSMSGPYPWGNRSVEYSEPKTPPTTNITRRYDFTVARGLAAPDGYERHMLLINGQFPGPRIEANWGDWIEVKVTNKIESPAEGTALHWHGMLQRETPWFDGVPSVAQCPIAPGETFTYRFRADQYGTSWYHAHFSAQYAGGAMGPMIIYGPSHVGYDEDLGMVMLSDYFHLDYRTLVERTMSTDVNTQILISDNTLVNGRMPWNCSLKAANDTAKCTGERGYSKWRVKLGKTYRMRLVNSGAAGIEYFSIDNHNVTVIANDFVEVEPYNTKWVTLGVGQRTDILFTPTGGPNDSFWLRTMQFGQFCGRANQPTGLGIILMDKAPANTIPTTIAGDSVSPLPRSNNDVGIYDPKTGTYNTATQCRGDRLEISQPVYRMPLPPATQTLDITLVQITNAAGHKVYLMNGGAFQANYNEPILWEAYNRTAFHDKSNVFDVGSTGSVRVNIWNNNTGPHPMHLHGHDFWVLHEGPGQWDRSSIVNPSNPARRDTINVIPGGHAVIQYNLDNPGTWPLHCHIAWHLAQGLSVTLMEKQGEINDRRIPETMALTCRKWRAWTEANTVDQLDAGI